MKKRVVIMGGGTFSDVRPHLSLCTRAFGSTARQMASMAYEYFPNMDIELVLTKMADHNSSLITNDHVMRYVDLLIADNTVKVIVFNVAMCDFKGTITGSDGFDLKQVGNNGEFEKTRLKSKHRYAMMLTPIQEKVIARIRRHRKDIFVIGFKTTSGATPDEQYAAGLNLLKKSSVNLVIANDIGTHNNMIITPEEGVYANGEPRPAVLEMALDMAEKRSHLSFTRSTVVDGQKVPWESPLVPSNLRTVINWLVEQGAYKEFNGATTGHFAVKLEPNKFLTSIRKTNFNDIAKNGMVLVTTDGPDNVTAYGARPSVGGQSQRKIFDKYPGADCIVHFHCPLKEDYENRIPIVSQFEYECGSHECGENTAEGLSWMGAGIYCVMLDNHGPNIVFDKAVHWHDVVQFIKENFDLSKPTNGFVQAYLPVMKDV